MSLIVYGDFACPRCYLASRRVDALNTSGAAVDWRAIEHVPVVTVGRRQLDQESGERLAADINDMRGSMLPGEDLPLSTPTFLPRTEAAVAGYAEAYGAGVGDDVRRLLFDAYWNGGLDIGDPEVLRRLLAGPIRRGHSTADPLRESGFAVSMNRGPITTEAFRRIRAWRAEWEGLGIGVLPTLLNGQTVSGTSAVRWLGERTVQGGTEFDAADLPDPARYPAVTVRPASSWVTQVGGPWALAYR